LIYHPKRCEQQFGCSKVYFDRPRGNQDPYIWNVAFLHSFCHITELAAPQAGDINFWVSGDKFPDFNTLSCDLVFVIDQRIEWADRNSIALSDPMVDSDLAFQDHYRWAERQHHFTKRKRITLKAEPAKSFQPQTSTGDLIDILPELSALGFTTSTLRIALKKGFASKPMPIDPVSAAHLFSFLQSHAAVRLLGSQLQTIRQNNPSLASPYRQKY